MNTNIKTLGNGSPVQLQKKLFQAWHGKTFVCKVVFPEETEYCAINTRSGQMIHCPRRSYIANAIRIRTPLYGLQYIENGAPDIVVTIGGQVIRPVPLSDTEWREIVTLLR